MGEKAVGRKGGIKRGRKDGMGVKRADQRLCFLSSGGEITATVKKEGGARNGNLEEEGPKVCKEIRRKRQKKGDVV